MEAKIAYTDAKNAVNDVLTKDGGNRLVQLLKTADQNKVYVGPDGQTYTGRNEVKDKDGNITLDRTGRALQGIIITILHPKNITEPFWIWKMKVNHIWMLP